MKPLVLMIAFLFLTTPVFAQRGGLPEKDPFDPTCRWDSAQRPYKEPNQQNTQNADKHADAIERAEHFRSIRESHGTSCKPNDQLCAADQFHVDWTGTGFEEVLAVIKNFSSPVNKQTCECDRSPGPPLRAIPDSNVKLACMALAAAHANGQTVPLSQEMLDLIAARCGPQDRSPNSPWHNIPESNVKLACMALTIANNRTVSAPQEMLDLVMAKIGSHVDTAQGATLSKMNGQNLIITGSVLLANERARVTSGHRSVDHEIERVKPRPGSHTSVEKSPTDFAAISTNGASTNWRSKNYDQAGTQWLVDVIRVLDPCAVMLFNDPKIIGVKPGRDQRGNVDKIHDNHIHVAWGNKHNVTLIAEVYRTGDHSVIDAMVTALQQERLEAGGLEHQQERFRSIAQQCEMERKMAEKQKVRHETDIAKQQALYEKCLREQQQYEPYDNNNR